MLIAPNQLKTIFSIEQLDALFPADRTHQFFDALLGDPNEGAYDIRLRYAGCDGRQLLFNLELHSRPGRCLACNLTFGLPKVFSRHPVIDVEGLIRQIDDLMNGQASCKDWQLGETRKINRELHVVPLIIDLA